MGLQLLLDTFVGGELAQAFRDLPAVFDRKEPKVTVSFAQYEVVFLAYLFGGGSEGGEGIGKAWAGEFPNDAIEVAWVGSDGGHLCCMDVDLSVPG